MVHLAVKNVALQSTARSARTTMLSMIMESAYRPFVPAAFTLILQKKVVKVAILHAQHVKVREIALLAQ